MFRGIKSAHWPIAQGTVLGSQIASYQAKSHRVYYPKVFYDYRVAGSSYTNQQFAFGNFAGSLEDIQVITNEYSVGKLVPVHYFPGNPQVAILETGLHNGLWTNLIVGTLFVLVGSFFLFAARKGKLLGRGPAMQQA